MDEDEDGVGGALAISAVVGVGRAVTRMTAPQSGVPYAEMIALAEAVEGRPLRLDLGAAAVFGRPILVLRERRGEDALKVLSPRERAVARLVSRGFSNRRISEDLGISLPTVKDHVHNALRKCGMACRAELAAAVARAES